MKLDLVRDKRQDEIVDKWQANGGKGTVLAATGFGKTRTLLKGMERLCNSPNAKKQRDVTVIVPSTPIYNDWVEHLSKYKNIPSKVYTIQSFVREFTTKNPLRTSLVLADEIHRYKAEVFGTLFRICRYNFLFGASATLDITDPKFAILQKVAPVIDRVPLQECQKNGWVSDFTIYNLGITMNSEEQVEYNKISRAYNKYFRVFDFDWETAMGCISDEQTLLQYSRHKGWDKQAVLINAVNFSRTVQKRKKFLYELETKRKLASEIIHKFPNRVFITFSQSSQFAEDLANDLGDIAVSYHSNMETHIIEKESKKLVARSVEDKGKTRYKDINDDEIHTWETIKEKYSPIKLSRLGMVRRKKQALKRLKDKRHKVRAISTAKSFDEGVNVPALSASIVTSGSGVTRQSIQRLGRTIRKTDEKSAFQVEIYVKDTQEEVWLRSRQQESFNIKWINSINEITE